MIRRTTLALAMIGAALPAATASAQTPPPFPGGGLPPVLSPPLLTPAPGTGGPIIRQFDCETIWVRNAEPPHRYEQVTWCRGWEIIRNP